MLLQYGQNITFFNYLSVLEQIDTALTVVNSGVVIHKLLDNILLLKKYQIMTMISMIF